MQLSTIAAIPLVKAGAEIGPRSLVSRAIDLRRMRRPRALCKSGVSFARAQRVRGIPYATQAEAGHARAKEN
jgi:hypothetical protein